MSMQEDALVDLLERAADAYENAGEPIMSDAAYDALFEKLRALNPANPFLYRVGAPPLTRGKSPFVPKSPRKSKSVTKSSSRAGDKSVGVNSPLPLEGTESGKIDSLREVDLPVPMMSLEKPKTAEAVNEWIAERSYAGFVCSSKIDGISAGLYIDTEGRAHMFTRGNGVRGFLISHILPHIEGGRIVERLSSIPRDTLVRGELMFSSENFTKLKGRFVNVRGGVKGTVFSLTLDREWRRIIALVDFVAYNIYTGGRVTMPPFRQLAALEREYGFRVPMYTLLGAGTTYEDLYSILQETLNSTPYKIDGLVVAQNNMDESPGDANPKNTIAFKVNSEEDVFLTTVVRVHWDPSMDGYIKPRVEIVPVEAEDGLLTFANGHNANYINTNRIGPGAIVRVIHSGSVIPYIIEVVSGAKTAQMPDEEYEWNETGADIVISDAESNPRVRIKRLLHFVQAVGAKWLGESTLEKLVENGYDSVVKILNADHEEIASIQGLEMRSALRLSDSLRGAIGSASLATLMHASHALGRGIGTSRCELAVESIPEILGTNVDLKSRLEEIDGIGPVTAAQAAANMPTFVAFLTELSESVQLSFEISEYTTAGRKGRKVTKTANGGKFTGMRFVFTGFRDEALRSRIESEGGKVVGTMSKKVDFLIHKGLDGRKAEFARENGIQAISLSEFVSHHLPQ
jgi:DNA ligase (NAD+)